MARRKAWCEFCPPRAIGSTDCEWRRFRRFAGETSPKPLPPGAERVLSHAPGVPHFVAKVRHSVRSACFALREITVRCASLVRQNSLNFVLLMFIVDTI